jgi:glutathione synthase/RimK-type ligase-like ATP-grasp enzyme
VAKDGIRVVFGSQLADGRINGLEARPGGWTEVRGLAVDAIHDRFPSQIRAESFARILAGRASRPMGNPLGFTMLCRDKVACQRTMEASGIPMPDLEEDPERFADRLTAWGAGFLKPRYGALGEGVRRVESGDTLEDQLPGVVPGRLEPAILQRAVCPPQGWAGRALRVLVQRIPSGWHHCPAVVRSSRTDPVANAARGAEVAPGPSTLSRPTLERVQAACSAVTTALDALPEARWAVEAGLDLVLDEENTPHLIEINSRPRGRLEVLARDDPATFGQAHLDAVARPLRMLAAWVTDGRS